MEVIRDSYTNLSKTAVVCCCQMNAWSKVLQFSSSILESGVKICFDYQVEKQYQMEIKSLSLCFYLNIFSSRAKCQAKLNVDHYV